MKSLGPHRALGAEFDLRADRRLAPLVSDAYADLRVPDTATGAHVVSAHRRRGMDDDEVLDDVRRRINDLAIGSAVPVGAVVRGGAVEIEGVAVAFVGGGGAGKSSLTAAACLRGHRYISDDVVTVDGDGKVRAYHRPVGLRLPVAAQLGVQVPDGPFDRTVPVRISTYTSLSPGAPLGLVVFVRRHPDATWCEPETASIALLRLSGHALGLDVVPTATFRRLEHIARHVPTRALWHHDLHAGLDLVEAEVTGLPPVSGRASRTGR